MRTTNVGVCSMSLSPLSARDLDLDCDLVRVLPLVLDDLVVLAITNITASSFITVSQRLSLTRRANLEGPRDLSRSGF